MHTVGNTRVRRALGDFVVGACTRILQAAVTTVVSRKWPWGMTVSFGFVLKREVTGYESVKSGGGAAAS